MARLRHANVVTVYDVGTVDDRDYVTMELMEGGTFEAWLQTPRSASEVAAAFIACGRGLVAAHAAGLVHRDVKPANVLRAADGRVALTDFGLAREHDSAPDRPRARSASRRAVDVTSTGIVLGTPLYMAPEQWSGDATPASDQFAFCVSMFEALAGVRPYGGEDDDTLIAAVERGPSAIDAAALRRVPRRFRRLLVRGLEPDAGKRWPSLAVLVDELVRAAAPAGRRRGGARRRRAGRRRRREHLRRHDAGARRGVPARAERARGGVEPRDRGAAGARAARRTCRWSPRSTTTPRRGTPRGSRRATTAASCRSHGWRGSTACPRAST